MVLEYPDCLFVVSTIGDVVDVVASIKCRAGAPGREDAKKEADQLAKLGNVAYGKGQCGFVGSLTIVNPYRVMPDDEGTGGWVVRLSESGAKHEVLSRVKFGKKELAEIIGLCNAAFLEGVTRAMKGSQEGRG